MGGGGGPAAFRHQRAELRALQDLRRQGSESEHRLASAGRRRRAELREHVSRERAISALTGMAPRICQCASRFRLCSWLERFRRNGHWFAVENATSNEALSMFRS